MQEAKKPATIKAENYGELLAQVNGMELVHFEEDGGYTGNYLVVLRDSGEEYDNTLGARLFYYIDHYGSCSGCDWLEAERDWNTGEVSYKEALEYCGDIKPKFITPESMPLKFIGEKYEGFKLTKK